MIDFIYFYLHIKNDQKPEAKLGIICITTYHFGYKLAIIYIAQYKFFFTFDQFLAEKTAMKTGTVKLNSQIAPNLIDIPSLG
jgi:hypothetical protein